MSDRDVDAKHFLGIVEANIDNEKLSDKQFREFIRNTLPIIDYKRPIKEKRAPSQPVEE